MASKSSDNANSGRFTEAAFGWAETVIGGEIVRREQMSRWRPTYFLDIQSNDGSVTKCYLRGYRSAGVTEDEAALSNTIGPELVRQNIADLKNLLGRPFNSENAGLAALEEQIKRDPEHHLEDTIRVLHRIECRMEFLQAPIQKFAGFSSLEPLQRM